ncbi:MAG: HTTM domain-containing protein [Saprospiraceae bacterium]|nr:HTTM domain-containing protein [Saprospiraceae bacterium]
MNWPTKFKNYLIAPTHGHILGLFRIVFGCFMVYEMLDYLQIDLVSNAFILPQVHLSYYDFLQPPSEPVLQIMLYAMLAAALLITLGLFLRPACFVLSSFYGYFLLLDKGIFNNHIYLFVLLSFVLAFTHADRFFSVKNIFGKEKMASLLIPRWEISILQFHFSIVYFYGGLAKINPDWLFRCEPVKTLLETIPADHPMAFWLKLDFQTAFETYGGLVFDLAIPFLLWYKRTRWWALVPLLLFHISNSLTFNDIGIFPFIMICATILYFEAEELPFLRKMVAAKPQGKDKKVALLTSPAWVEKLLIGYVVFQLLFPFRGLFLPNPVNWTMIANRFAWRMKSQSRLVDEFSYTIQDGPNGERFPVEIDKFINPMQINAAAHDPIAAATVAKGLAKQGKERGMAAPIVKANIRVRWNGYPTAFTVNPEVDLSKVEYSPFKKLDWVMPVPQQ